MRTLIGNFCDTADLEIKNAIHGNSAAFLYLTQYSGSMHFQHAMSIEQARTMADALLAHADAAEKELQDARNIV